MFQRSEEHTSELQSRLHLVCRLLLEKKRQFQYEKTQSRIGVAILGHPLRLFPQCTTVIYNRIYPAVGDMRSPCAIYAHWESGTQYMLSTQGCQYHGRRCSLRT